jgi:diguanylate cyclase (GGDEF)-like protein/PAS domain S-box-containing protein/putative nucleotidyltransferase with HDIG domain
VELAEFAMPLKDYKISNQIIITQLIIILVILVMGLFSFFTIDSLVQTNETLREHPVATKAALSSLKEDILNIRLIIDLTVLGEGSLPSQSQQESIVAYEVDAGKQLDILENTYLGPKLDLSTLKDEIGVYSTIRIETLRLLSIGKLAEAQQRVMSGGISDIQTNKIAGSIRIMEDYSDKKADQLNLQADETAKLSLLIFAILMLSVSAVSGVTLRILRKRILNPLIELKRAIDNYSQGELTSRSLITSKNEVGVLSTAFNSMAEKIEEDSQFKIKNAAELIAAKMEISSQAKLILIQKAYYLNKQLFQATLRAIGDAVISCDIKSNIVFMNKVAEQLTGWNQTEATGLRAETVFNIVNEKTREKCEDIINQVLLTKKVIELDLNTILISKDGSERPVEDSAAPIFNEAGELVGAVLIFRDVTEKRESIKGIEYLGYHDKLTDLYNRRFYEEEIRRLDTERNLPLTLVMGDVNGLKLINDSFGHNNGDELLLKVAKAFKDGFRSDDIVARLGGDEFIVILPNTDKVEAEIIISRIKTHLVKEDFLNLPISISFGHGTKYNTDQSMHQIFKDAEDDMYKKKLYESSSMRGRTVDLIMKTIYEKNEREMYHSRRVSELCEALAKKMGFDNENINKIRLAGLMHDIGKISIDEGILNKVEKLTLTEFNDVKRHSEVGYRILSSVIEFSEIANYVLEHHERWDGLGYPKGLKGDQISIQGRMICIADAFDAMTRDRTYKEKLSETEAFSEIRKFAGTQFDPNITEQFIEVMMEISKNTRS